MAKFDVLDMNGKKVSTVELSDAVFGITPNEKAVHAAVVNFLANQRQGTQSTKTRSEVSGGGRKPWRQKGTGHARQGSTRSPQWTHGGVALGPKPRDYSYRINRKVKRLAILSAISTKAAAGDMILVDNLSAVSYTHLRSGAVQRAGGTLLAQRPQPHPRGDADLPRPFRRGRRRGGPARPLKQKQASRARPARPFL